MDKDNLGIKIGLIFYISSIFGYIYELILTLISKGKLFSHSFLYGPWLPIYGIGSLLILLLYKYHRKPLVIFMLSFILTGTFEYLSGLFLLKVLKMRLWDYTGYFLNINGLVCFLSAFCFAVGGILVTYVLYPIVLKIIKRCNLNYLKIILIIISILFGIDGLSSIFIKHRSSIFKIIN